MEIIIGLIVLSLAAFFISALMPALIAIAIAIELFKYGHAIWAVIVIIVGIITNIGMLYGEFGDIGGGYTGSSGGRYHEEEHECPYCGSGDTDGNHCYNCDEDF